MIDDFLIFINIKKYVKNISLVRTKIGHIQNTCDNLVKKRFTVHKNSSRKKSMYQFSYLKNMEYAKNGVFQQNSKN